MTGEVRVCIELDFIAQRSLAKGLGLVMGASILSPSDAARSSGIGLGDDGLKWGYVQLTASFQGARLSFGALNLHRRAAGGDHD